MNLEIRDLQMLQLEIAKEVKRICEINQIDYFLAGGTLLGAVRHQGFIPWDDDIDIGMKLTEYKKFLVCCKDQLDERFELQTWDLDLSYGMPFAKIRLCNTTMEEKVQPKEFLHNGIWLDIFPYISTSTHKTTKFKMMQLNLIGKAYMIKCGYKVNQITPKRVSRGINCALYAISSIFTGAKIKGYYTSLIEDLLDNDGNLLLECDGRFTGAFIFDKNFFIGHSELQFENIKFQVPTKYKAYLESAYGDYMQLPPESEREKGHQVVECTLDKIYEDYFK